jgi:hypothetical protein
VTLISFQRIWQQIRLKVFGDEFYVRQENNDGSSAIYDADLWLHAYTSPQDELFVSNGQWN